MTDKKTEPEVDRFNLGSFTPPSSVFFTNSLIEMLAGQPELFNIFELPLTDHEVFVFMRHLKDLKDWPGAVHMTVLTLNDHEVSILDDHEDLVKIPLHQIATVLNKELGEYNET